MCVSTHVAHPQVYGGVVYMDFNKEHMQTHGGAGVYQSLKPQLLPRLWLIFCDNPSDSGKMHSTVKQRWLAGEADVVQGMQQVAQCAEQGRWVWGRAVLGCGGVLWWGGLRGARGRGAGRGVNTCYCRSN